MPHAALVSSSQPGNAVTTMPQPAIPLTVRPAPDSRPPAFDVPLLRRWTDFPPAQPTLPLDPWLPASAAPAPQRVAPAAPDPVVPLLDAEQWSAALALAVFETLHGRRPVGQLTRWVDDRVQSAIAFPPAPDRLRHHRSCGHAVVGPRAAPPSRRCGGLRPSGAGRPLVRARAPPRHLGRTLVVYGPGVLADESGAHRLAGDPSVEKGRKLQLPGAESCGLRTLSADIRRRVTTGTAYSNRESRVGRAPSGGHSSPPPRPTDQPTASGSPERRRAARGKWPKLESRRVNPSARPRSSPASAGCPSRCCR